MAENSKTSLGVITQIVGAVLDIRFQDGNLPEINEAIHIKRQDGDKLVVEVAQHLVMIPFAVLPWDQRMVWSAAWKQWQRELRFVCR